MKMKVFERIISDPVEVNCLDEIPLTVAKVHRHKSWSIYLTIWCMKDTVL